MPLVPLMLWSSFDGARVVVTRERASGGRACREGGAHLELPVGGASREAGARRVTKARRLSGLHTRDRRRVRVVACTTRVLLDTTEVSAAPPTQPAG